MIPINNDMRFEVTTKCNYNCIICPREKITRKMETMSLGLFKEIFDKITSESGQYDTLTFPGMGEPLLDETLKDKIVYAKGKNIKLSVLLLSNGFLLTPEKFRELEDSGLTSVRVSLYGNDPVSYTRVHRTKNHNSFNIVKQNLLEICRIKKTAKLLLTFNVVDGFNDSVTNDWIEFWKEKVDLVEVWRPHNWVDGREYRKTQAKKLNTCGRPLKGPLQIQVDGTINMCCFDFDGKLTLGDLKKQSLKEIFNSALFNKIKECHRIGDFRRNGLICGNCDQRNLDKSDVMLYNSKFDIEERVNMISTTYQKVIK